VASEDVDRVRAALAAWREGDEDAYLRHQHPEVEFIPMRSVTEGVFHGHEGIRRFLADTRENFEYFDIDVEFEDLGAGRVLMWGTVHAKGRGSGAEINVPTAGVIELEDGLIRRWRDVGTRERALEEAGGAR